MDQLCSTTNVARRLTRSKEFQPLGSQVEIVLDQWLQRFCQSWLDEEFTVQCGARRYERTAQRHDVRHGPDARRLVTSRGVVTLQAPRGRTGRYVYSLFERYRRHTPAFEAAVVASVLAGHSTRRARTFFRDLFSQDVVSQQTASRLLRRFDGELAAWRQQALPDSLAVLVLDAVYLRGTDATRRARPVLVALGVHPDGRQELLAFQCARSESQAAWERFAQQLHARGLVQVACAVHDDCPAIASAVALCWPAAREQWRICHALQALARGLQGHPQRRQILQAARWLYEARSQAEFAQWARQFCSRWRRHLTHPAVAAFVAHWPETTQYFALPKSWWPAAKTTNLLERWFEEVRRRQRVFRRFPHVRSCERWVYALLTQYNHTHRCVFGWESHQDS